MSTAFSTSMLITALTLAVMSGIQAYTEMVRHKLFLIHHEHFEKQAEWIDELIKEYARAIEGAYPNAPVEKDEE